jgi:hypothetical protein
MPRYGVEQACVFHLMAETGRSPRPSFVGTRNAYAPMSSIESQWGSCRNKLRPMDVFPRVAASYVPENAFAPDREVSPSLIASWCESPLEPANKSPAQ